jgi:hypothetical protein
LFILYLFPDAVVALHNIIFAKRASCIYVKPFVDACAVKMVAAWKLSKLSTILIG